MDLVQGISAFASAHGGRAKTFEGVARGLLVVLRGALRYNMTPGQLKEDLTALGAPPCGGLQSSPSPRPCPSSI